MNESYLLIKQIDKRYDNIHYYIVNNNMTKVIGRFDVGCRSTAGITYHIIDEYQNRGIGQTALNFVVGDLFKNYKVEEIWILAINDISKNIALKSGFSKKRERLYKLSISECLN